MIDTKRLSKEEIENILSVNKLLFFIGIGGISMSSLAFIAKEKGFDVSGSDRSETHITQKLSAFGIDVKIGHDTENVRGADAVIFTAAIKEDNPEVIAARQAGIPFIYRADFLNYVMHFSKCRVGISGMHGKSTTSALISHIMLSAGCDPTVLIGAELDEIGGTYHIGKGDVCVFEADEYSDSFLSFSPTVAMILNIDLDHVDYFSSLDHIKRSFITYANKVGPDGLVVADIDCENVRSILPFVNANIVSYGIDNPNAMYTAKNIKFEDLSSGFDIYKHGRFVIHSGISLPGIHSVSDAIGAFAVLDNLGLDPSDIVRGMLSYRSAKRRMEFKGYLAEAAVYEDYAHHPSEISATLKGIKNMAKGRVFCAFQPHTYSRTAGLLSGFIEALGLCDVAILADIYAARETNTYGISSLDIASAIDGAVYLESFDKIADYLRDNVKKDDLVIVMGAGDIYKLSDMLTK